MQQKLTDEFGLHIEKAQKQLKNIVKHTPLEFSTTLSNLFEANVYLKREDLQVIRAYKIRGAYNMMNSLPKEELKKGVVCASAGNHAQGVALSCSLLEVKGVIFMPKTTPKQKIEKTEMFGKNFIEIILIGDTFDESAIAAKEYTEKHSMIFIPPFDHIQIIEGQGTVGLEILEDWKSKDSIDYIFIPIGGGGLCAGVGSYFKDNSPETKVIGVEPSGAASMKAAFKNNHPIKLRNINKFVDGASVQRVGDLTFAICSKVINDICLVPEGEVCSTIINLYNKDAIVVEPAGALSVTALNHYKKKIKGKNVVCVISGSNNDIDRMQEIKEQSLIFEGLKHYFIIQLPQRQSALKDFVSSVFNEHVDIVRFEYMKKNYKNNGPALLGIELDSVKQYDKFIERMDNYGLSYTMLDPNSDLGYYIV